MAYHGTMWNYNNGNDIQSAPYGESEFTDITS